MEDTEAAANKKETKLVLNTKLVMVKMSKETKNCYERQMVK